MFAILSNPQYDLTYALVCMFGALDEANGLATLHAALDHVTEVQVEDLYRQIRHGIPSIFD